MSKKNAAITIICLIAIVLSIFTSCIFKENKSEQAQHMEKLFQDVLDLNAQQASDEKIKAAVELAETYWENEFPAADMYQVDNYYDYKELKEKLDIAELKKEIDEFMKTEVKYTKEYEEKLFDLTNRAINLSDSLFNTIWSKREEFLARREECRIKCTCTVPKETCSYCGGRGKKLYSGYDDWGIKVYADSAVTCSMCGGKGYTSCCPKCEGAGYLYEYEE